MKLSDQFNRTLKVIDESATNYLTSCCAIMYEEQKDLLRTAIKSNYDAEIDVTMFFFLNDFNDVFLAEFNIEDKVFLTEQFERFFNGNAKEQQ